MKVLGKVLYLCTRQNIQVSKYSNGLLTLNLLLLLSMPQDAPTGEGRGGGGGPGGKLASPAVSLYPQHQGSKMALRTGGLA